MTKNELFEKYGNDKDLLNKELKRVASIKCRLKKQLGKKDNKEKLIEVERYEDALKEIRDLVVDRKKRVTEYEWEDIESLSYEEVSRAINSIKSKKSLSRWLTENEGDNDEFRSAVRIEEMLYKRKAMVEGDKKSTKAILQEIVDMSETLSKEEIVEMLKELI